MIGTPNVVKVRIKNNYIYRGLIMLNIKQFYASILELLKVAAMEKNVNLLMVNKI